MACSMQALRKKLLLVVVRGDRPHVVVAAQLDLLLLEPDRVRLAKTGAEPLVQRVDELRKQAAGLVGLPPPALTGQPGQRARLALTERKVFPLRDEVGAQVREHHGAGQVDGAARVPRGQHGQQVLPVVVELLQVRVGERDDLAQEGVGAHVRRQRVAELFGAVLVQPGEPLDSRVECGVHRGEPLAKIVSRPARPVVIGQSKVTTLKDERVAL